MCFADKFIINGENIKTIKYSYFSTKIMGLFIVINNL